VVNRDLMCLCKLLECSDLSKMTSGQQVVNL
jgi:hypothetical protein